MSASNQFNRSENEEVSVKELILTIQSYIAEFVSGWKILVLFGLLGGIVLVFKAWLDVPKYNAAFTFMVNEDQGNSLGPLGGFLGNILPGSGGSEYNLDRIVELSKSRRIIEPALFEKEVIDNKNDFIANHLIREYEFHEEWKKDTTGLSDFVFKNGAYDDFGRTESKAISALFGFVRGNPATGAKGLLDANYGEETAILKMTLESTNEMLSISLLNAVYDKLSSFYINKSIEKPLQTYQNIKAKADSLNNELEAADISLASFEDRNKGLVTSTAKLKQQRLKRQTQILTIAYGKALENLEVADFSLKNATPFFQVIDPPQSPISPDRSSKLISLIIGGLMGGVIGIIFLTFRKIYRDIMAG